MENEKIQETKLQVEQLMKTNPEIYGWIVLKEKKDFLTKEISTEEGNTKENLKELKETQLCMETMKKKYSSIKLYEALVSLMKMYTEKR